MYLPLGIKNTGGIYLAVTRVSTSKITIPYSDWCLYTENEGASKFLGFTSNHISNVESISKFRNLSIKPSILSGLICVRF
jgi:hypothetical protein